MRWISLCLFLCLVGSLSAQNDMNNRKLRKILQAEAEAIQGKLGRWELLLDQRLVMVITDDEADRMRIFTPVIPEDEIADEELRNMLIANFHTALDAKYCLFEGFVISIYTHPLKALRKEQVQDALRQVVTLADNFGTTYSSSEFVFPAPQVSDSEKPRTPKSAKKTRRTTRS